MEVVDFLNHLWAVSDDIINKFNVYKVRDCKGGAPIGAGGGVMTPTFLGKGGRGNIIWE